ncbi:MAG: hypothetical protein HQM16_06510 [Deltaproteobacteria bacterium]|nr:hypothetical protein [Deltaproteobacteria bacterium]
MNKKITAVLVLVTMFFVTGSTRAGFIKLPKINTGNSIVDGVANQATENVKNQALTKAINQTLKKLKCEYTDDTTATDTTCDLGKVVAALQAFGVGLDATVVKEVTINVLPSVNPKVAGVDKVSTARVKAMQKKLGNNITVKIKGQRLSMYYRVEPELKAGNALKFSVDLK